MTGVLEPVEAPALLDFVGVTKWYGPIAAVMGVSFRVGAEVVGLVGKNGVGKSTLMKLAAGLLRPNQGRVSVLGHESGSRAARALFGFCPDADRLYEDLSAVTFVAWMLRFHGLTRPQAFDRSAQVLNDLGLGANMHRPIREYSKGMRQRVRLAQALAHRPRVVLLDEPMTGLDPLARAELTAAILDLPARGVGVLVSSHVLHELEAVVDRVVLIHQGRLVADGRIAELREQMNEQPHRLRLVGDQLRQLAACVVAWPQVRSVAVGPEALEVSISGAPGFYEALTDLGARWPGGLREIVPLDDSLAAVFGYLVG